MARCRRDHRSPMRLEHGRLVRNFASLGHVWKVEGADHDAARGQRAGSHDHETAALAAACAMCQQQCRRRIIAGVHCRNHWRGMMSRSRAVAVIAVPIAVLLAANDARVQAGTQGASRSGVDLTALDRSANPCVDFYQFTCGGWLAKNPAPPDQPRYGRFEELQNRNNEILRDILEEAAKSTSNPQSKKIGDYYASCMGEDTIEAKGTAPLAPDFDRVEAIKSKADIPAVVGRMHTLGESGFFGFGSGPDFKDATHYILIYAQGGLGLPDRDYYLKDDPDTIKLRNEYEQHVARMLQLAGDSPQKAAAAAKAVTMIETTLAKAALDRVS